MIVNLSCKRVSRSEPKVLNEDIELSNKIQQLKVKNKIVNDEYEYQVIANVIDIHNISFTLSLDLKELGEKIEYPYKRNEISAENPLTEILFEFRDLFFFDFVLFMSNYTKNLQWLSPPGVWRKMFIFLVSNWERCLKIKGTTSEDIRV